jgi:hypothetical protein
MKFVVIDSLRRELLIRNKKNLAQFFSQHPFKKGLITGLRMLGHSCVLTVTSQSDYRAENVGAFLCSHSHITV